MTAKSKKTQSCGSCYFVGMNPKAISATTKVIKLKVDFEGALKLKAAIDECVAWLNKYNRASSAGRNSRMEIAVYVEKERIQVLKGKS